MPISCAYVEAAANVPLTPLEPIMTIWSAEKGVVPAGRSFEPRPISDRVGFVALGPQT